MRGMRLQLAVVAFAVAGGTSCSTSPVAPDALTTLRTSTSFGFCLGYCRATLDITSVEMVYVEESRQGELPPVRRVSPVSAAEWKSLVDALDRAALERLPATVGCPDCADGGAESLEVFGSDWQKRVTFEFGAAMPELQPLLARVRTLRERFEPTVAPR